MEFAPFTISKAGRYTVGTLAGFVLMVAGILFVFTRTERFGPRASDSVRPLPVQALSAEPVAEDRGTTVSRAQLELLAERERYVQGLLAATPSDDILLQQAAAFLSYPFVDVVTGYWYAEQGRIPSSTALQVCDGNEPVESLRIVRKIPSQDKVSTIYLFSKSAVREDGVQVPDERIFGLFVTRDGHLTKTARLFSSCGKSSNQLFDVRWKNARTIELTTGFMGGDYQEELIVGE